MKFKSVAGLVVNLVLVVEYVRLYKKLSLYWAPYIIYEIFQCFTIRLNIFAYYKSWPTIKKIYTFHSQNWIESN